MVVLDDSIPEKLRQRSGHLLKQAAVETGNRSAFEFRLLPPLANVVEFDMPLTRSDEGAITVMLQKTPRCIDDRREGKAIRIGWTVSMQPYHAREVERFFEKHK